MWRYDMAAIEGILPIRRLICSSRFSGSWMFFESGYTVDSAATVLTSIAMGCALSRKPSMNFFVVSWSMVWCVMSCTQFFN